MSRQAKKEFLQNTESLAEGGHTGFRCASKHGLARTNLLATESGWFASFLDALTPSAPILQHEQDTKVIGDSPAIFRVIALHEGLRELVRPQRFSMFIREQRRVGS